MARPLRIEIAGGRYHVTARGNERGDIFKDDGDRKHFLGLLAKLPERFGTRIHAYVLMPNHFHLLLETPETNLSRTGQWLNVSYSVWFNRRHRRSGHLFQGRFGAALIEDDAGLQEVARYLHLNPVRVRALGLDKRGRAVSKSAGLPKAPSAEVLAARLAVLRTWKWSSYRVFAGYCEPPEWLTRDVVGRLCGGRSTKERQAALRAYTELAIREGLAESPWERLIGGAILGTETFAREVRQKLKGNRREQPGLGKLGRRVDWEQIVKAVESAKGEAWESFRDRHGDWGRDAALWLGRRVGRMTLGQLAERIGGVDYTAAGAAASRFDRRPRKERKLAATMTKLTTQLSNMSRCDPINPKWFISWRIPTQPMPEPRPLAPTTESFPHRSSSKRPKPQATAHARSRSAWHKPSKTEPAPPWCRSSRTQPPVRCRDWAG